MNSVTAQNKRKAESTLEYIILVAGMTAMIILFLKPSGAFEEYYKKIFQGRKADIDTMSKRGAVACKKKGQSCKNPVECCSYSCPNNTVCN